MRIHVLLLAAVALVLASQSAAAFTDLTLNVTVQLNPDGTAHVIEESRISLDSMAEIDTFTSSMAAIGTTIEDWRKLTNSANIRYHTTAVPVNTNLAPKMAGSIAVIMIEYDTSEPLVSIDKETARKSSYTLDQNRFNFQTSRTGALVLPQGTTLSVVLPQDAILMNAIPQPTSVDGRTYTWRGPFTIARFDFSYERQQSLGTEVSEFFSDVGHTMSGFLGTALGGLTIVIIVLALLVLGLMRRHSS